MKIVIVTPILFDSSSPFNHLMRDILQGLLDAGHQVTRIVAIEDKSDSDYTMGLDKIEYIPVKRKKAKKSNIISRYLYDTLTNIKMAARIARTGADVLFEDASYSSYWSVRAAKKAGMRVVCMLQDIWPDDAVQSGLIGQNSLVYRYFEMWQRKVYRKSDRFICISDDIKTFMTGKGIPPEKIRVIYNWGYTDDPVDIPWEENNFVRKYQPDRNKFYAVYAGNIGRMQNVGLVLDAAALLTERSDIEFLIIGDGVMRNRTEERAAALPNVRMLPLQPGELATGIYSMAGVNLIPLVKGGEKTALPSKTGVILSCGRPVIFCFGEESAFAARVREYGCGACVSPTDPVGLAEAIRTEADRRTSVNEGARRLFASDFSRSRNIAKYTDAIIE